MISVAVSGALGRMGRLACKTVNDAPDLRYAGGFARTPLPEEDIDDDIGRLLDKKRPDVIVDFTTRPATQDVARAAVERGIVPIVGSSEWNASERADLARRCDRTGTGALLVPNFALGAVLMMRFAEQAAPYFPTVEILEMHRAEKRDKPSGTAAVTAERIAEHGGPRDVPVHSLRLQGALAHQEVRFGAPGELLTVRHDSLSRESFAAGILLAVRGAANVRGLQIGLETVMA